ncbi:hypothetical protein HMPREF0063_10204 [Aeromicrobium marinum DSM 15272]|uniref:DUF222 domain-containing protein n=2 Tax=Aeromicrobium marinum TaxID=219314 RepID=E2S847_9ACTN|nr:hypothetical protein HMPREF0063_10204 [Aeromicrobium marinum DSM 15272]
MTAEELVARTRNRAHVHLLQGHRAAVDRIAAEIVTTGSGEAVGDLATQTRATADGYVTSDVFDDLVSRYNLTEGTGTTSNVTLRVTSFDPETIRQIAAAGEVLAGLDLADSLDTRERAAGLQVLTAALGADR